MNGRVERLRAEMGRLEVASFLVSNPVNVRYLTGFESSNAFVLVQHKEVVLMNEVKADVEAVVRKVCVENAQPVEYGQLLFELEPLNGRPLDAL